MLQAGPVQPSTRAGFQSWQFWWKHQPGKREGGSWVGALLPRPPQACSKDTPPTAPASAARLLPSPVRLIMGSKGRLQKQRAVLTPGPEPPALPPPSSEPGRGTRSQSWHKSDDKIKQLSTHLAGWELYDPESAPPPRLPSP